MVDFVPDDLCRKTSIGFEASFKALVLILYLDRSLAFGHSRAGERQSAVLGLVSPGTFNDLRVEHRGHTAAANFVVIPRVSQ